jgi:hypothetical protein
MFEDRISALNAEALAAWHRLPKAAQEAVESRARAEGHCPPIGFAWSMYAFMLFFSGQIVGAGFISSPILFWASPIVVALIAEWQGPPKIAITS